MVIRNLASGLRKPLQSTILERDSRENATKRGHEKEIPTENTGSNTLNTFFQPCCVHALKFLQVNSDDKASI